MSGIARKARFINYLEVIVDAEGRVMYAVPSHQEKLIDLACQKLGVTREGLYAMTPQEYYWDFMTWLCQITGCIAVWTRGCTGVRVTQKQRATMRRLKMEGLYKGAIPFRNEKGGGKRT